MIEVAGSSYLVAGAYSLLYHWQQHRHGAVAQHGGRNAAVKQVPQKVAWPIDEHEQVGAGAGQGLRNASYQRRINFLVEP